MCLATVLQDLKTQDKTEAPKPGSTTCQTNDRQMCFPSGDEKKKRSADVKTDNRTEDERAAIISGVIPIS